MNIYRNYDDGSTERALKDNVEIPFREKEESKEEEKKEANQE